jgi:predicted nuclease with TOPRIM domain
MAEDIKFTEDELKEIETIQKSYFDIQNKFGQVRIARLKLEQQLESLDNEEDNLHKNFDNIQNDEKTFLENITEKYGEGNLNPDTGIFTPNK